VARLFGVLAVGALLAVAGGTHAAPASDSSVGPACLVEARGYVCIGARPRHVVVSLSPWAGSWVYIFKSGDPWGARIAEFHIPFGDASPAYGESPDLRPGVYFVDTSSFLCPPPGCITIMTGFSAVVRVPGAITAKPPNEPRPARPSKHIR
jgi:hypothetical protein